MTYIIAEVGSNWTSLEDCFEAIAMASKCGAHAVKFQMYTHKELYGMEGSIPGVLPRDWVQPLAKACAVHEIDFMCTAFSVDGYRFLDKHVRTHKIASAENTDPTLLKEVFRLEKPIMISSGGSGEAEIQHFLEALRPRDVTLMYCVSNYPAVNIDLRHVPYFEKFLQSGLASRIGYSCHTSDWITPVNAVLLGAKVIEKHFKVRETKSPDNPHSIMPEDFKRMVDRIKEINAEKKPETDPQEAEFVKIKRRFVPGFDGYYRTKS